MALQKVVRPWYQSWWFIAIIVVLFCVVFGALTFKSIKTPAPAPTPSHSTGAAG